MSNGSGVSRGDRNRNARLARLRSAVSVSNAVVGIDLADVKQMVVVCDHDSKVLARRTFRCKAWDLGAALDWAADHAARHGFAGVRVACEPTGHRWRILGQLASDRAMSFVCVQPTMSAWARKSEDLTFDKTDLLTELASRSVDLGLRRRSALARFRSCDQRRGCATGAVWFGGAAARLA